MSRRPIQDVRIWAIQDRSGHERTARPYLVRWAVDGKRFSKSHRTKAQADWYRSRLMTAHRDGERFDARTGEPTSWSPAAEDLLVYEWARMWIRQEWTDWAPRSRKSAIESLARFLPLIHDVKAPDAPADIRAHLTRSLAPGAKIDDSHEAEKWLAKWGLSLGELSRENLAEIVHKLGIGDKGQALAAQTAGRYRKNSHACIRRAVELGRLESDPWPPTPRGRSQRKANRKPDVIDVRRLPDPDGMAAVLKAMRSHQPGSRTYQLMTAVMYYAGLRPSEVVMLRPRALDLPEKGWGLIKITEADIDFDEPGEPKTGDRDVPIPPELAGWLQRWIDARKLPPTGLLFRTRTGKMPNPSNWCRSLHRGCRLAGRANLRVYDARHACATTWLRAGVPLGEAARRLGHSVETLVSVYVGALEGDDLEANRRIDDACRTSRAWLADQEKASGGDTAPAKMRPRRKRT